MPQTGVRGDGCGVGVVWEAGKCVDEGNLSRWRGGREDEVRSKRERNRAGERVNERERERNID